MITLDLLPTPILVTGPMGRILSINQSLLALIAGKASDWLGGSMDALFPASVKILMQTQVWPLLLQQGRIQETYLLIHAARQTAIPVLASCQRQLLNGTDAYFWVFSVMLERSRFEQEILASRNEARQTALDLKDALQVSAQDQAQLLLALNEHEVAKSLLKQNQLNLAQATRIAKLGVWRNERPDAETFNSIACLWSDEMYALLGYTAQSLPVPTVAAYLARVHPDDRPILLATAKKSRAEKAAWQTEYRLVRGDGTECLVEENGEFIFDANGEVESMLGVVKDITDKKKAELNLVLHRDHLEELVRDRTSALVESARETKSVNRSLHMLSRCNMAIVHAKDEHQLLNELCQRICESGDFLLAWVGLIPPGLDAALVPVAQFGRRQGFLKSIQASWAIEQASGTGPICAAMSTAQTQLSRNFGNDPVNVLWREVGQANQARSLIALPLLHEEKMLGVLTIHSEHTHAFLAPEVVLLEELTRNIAFGLKTLRARHELDRYQLRLEDLVATRTAELSEAKNIADAANLAKGSFLATMSHELRTPLNAIIGLSGLMVDSKLSPRQRDYANKIQHSGNTLCALIDDILDFSKIETGEAHLVLAPLSLKALVRSIHEIAFISLGSKPIEGLFDIAQDVPDSLVGDALRLQQILLNLCSNAIKFTHAGEIVFSVACALSSETEVTLQFSVRDTGIGIPLDMQASIFDEFTQADSSISRIFGGTGLGLAISARLVQLMGGQLSVDSEPGVGSTFSFAVKLIRGQSPQVPCENNLPEGLRVLIVDDHPLARDIHARNCLALGWLPTVRASGAEGLEELLRSSADDSPFDLLLLDWHMPGMDGLDMLQRAHNLSELVLPLVILMTPAFDLENAALATAEMGLDGFVAKPLVVDALKDAVNLAYAGEFTEILPMLGKPDRLLSGMRLLVAEDNLLNQEVIEQVLTQAGATVTLASNGLAAVALLRGKNQHFDAVLMDVQMPVMDGYTATRLIREELGLRDLPIIAVTAHARPDDREKTRQAGMAGHLVKPLNVKDLLAVVVQVCGKTKDTFPMDDVLPAMTVLSSSHTNGIDLAAAVAFFGGRETACLDMLKQFWDQHGADAAKLRLLLGEQQVKEAIAVLHSLCGIAGFLQAKGLAHCCAAAEEALRADEHHNMEGSLLELETVMQLVHADLLAFEKRLSVNV
jgi:PAS domain S-box-containing protein